MKDQIRAEFEQQFPLPNGVTFDGDHYVADPNVLGSFQNATIWSHMYRGWRSCKENEERNKWMRFGGFHVG